MHATAKKSRMSERPMSFRSRQAKCKYPVTSLSLSRSSPGRGITSELRGISELYRCTRSLGFRYGYIHGDNNLKAVADCRQGIRALLEKYFVRGRSPDKSPFADVTYTLRAVRDTYQLLNPRMTRGSACVPLAADATLAHHNQPACHRYQRQRFE